MSDQVIADKENRSIEGYAGKFIISWLAKYAEGDDDTKNNLLLEIVEEAAANIKVLKKLKEKHPEILFLNYINLELGEETRVTDLIDIKIKENKKLLDAKIDRAKNTPNVDVDTKNKPKGLASLLEIRNELPEGEEIIETPEIEDNIEDDYNNQFLYGGSSDYYYEDFAVNTQADKPKMTLETADKNSPEDLEALYPNISFQSKTRIKETYSDEYAPMTLDMLEQEEAKLFDDTIFEVPGLIVGENRDIDKTTVMQVYPNIDVRVLAKHMGYEIINTPVYSTYTTYQNRERGFGVDAKEHSVIDYYTVDFIKNGKVEYSSERYFHPPKDVVAFAEHLQMRLDAQKDNIKFSSITNWIRNLKQLPTAFSKVKIFRVSQNPAQYNIKFIMEYPSYNERKSRMGIGFTEVEFNLNKTNFYNQFLGGEQYKTDVNVSFVEEVSEAFQELAKLEWYGKSTDNRDLPKVTEWYEKYKERLNPELDKASFYVSMEGKLMFKPDLTTNYELEVGCIGNNTKDPNSWIIDTVGEKTKWDRRYKFKFYSEEKPEEPQAYHNSRMRRR
jgi:hypothetical protein